MGNRIKLKENELQKIIEESVKKIIKEYEEPVADNGFASFDTSYFEKLLKTFNADMRKYYEHVINSIKNDEEIATTILNSIEDIVYKISNGKLSMVGKINSRYYDDYCVVYGKAKIYDKNLSSMVEELSDNLNSQINDLFDEQISGLEGEMSQNGDYMVIKISFYPFLFEESGSSADDLLGYDYIAKISGALNNSVNQ